MVWKESQTKAEFDMTSDIIWDDRRWDMVQRDPKYYKVQETIGKINIK